MKPLHLLILLAFLTGCGTVPERGPPDGEEGREAPGMWILEVVPCD